MTRPPGRALASQARPSWRSCPSGLRSLAQDNLRMGRNRSMLFLSGLRGFAPRARKASQRIPTLRGPSFGASLHLLPPLSARAKGCMCNPLPKKFRTIMCKSSPSFPLASTRKPDPGSVSFWQHAARSRKIPALRGSLRSDGRTKGGAYPHGLDDHGKLRGQRFRHPSGTALSKASTHGRFKWVRESRTMGKTNSDRSIQEMHRIMRAEGRQRP